MFPACVTHFPRLAAQGRGQFTVILRVWAPRVTQACHTHFLGVSLSQSEGRDPDLDQSEIPHLETRDKNILIKLTNGLRIKVRIMI